MQSWASKPTEAKIPSEATAGGHLHHVLAESAAGEWVRPLRAIRQPMMGLSALVLFCAAAGSSAAEPMHLRSEAGHLTMRVTGIDHPEHVNRLHGFALSLATDDGMPVAGATIVVTGRRRYAPNPLPTSPKVSSGPDKGNYRIEGLRFHMPGEWQLHFAIDFGQIRDRASIDVMVK